MGLRVVPKNMAGHPASVDYAPSLGFLLPKPSNPLLLQLPRIRILPLATQHIPILATWEATDLLKDNFPVSGSSNVFIFTFVNLTHTG